MKFLLDHDVPVNLARVLRKAGHDVMLVPDALSRTATDENVFRHAITLKRVVVTCNRDDFLELAAENEHSGLIVLIRRRSRILECAAFMRLLAKAGEQGIVGNINYA